MTQTPCRAGKQPAGPQIACSKTTMGKISYTRREIEQLVVMQRLYLYNHGLPCGAKAILLTLNQISLLPLPSESTIKRILAKNGLTHNRTGFYP
jgi:hypothetical protein